MPAASPNQNWGWGYQILPYLEQGNAWKEPRDEDAAVFVYSLYFCPSRRRPVALQGTQSGMASGLRGQCDYAGNGGIGKNVLPGVATPAAAVFTGGLQGGTWPGQNGTVVPPVPYPISVVRVKDGTSNTVLVGERNYNVGKMNRSIGAADENNGYVDGYDWDMIRWAYDLSTGHDGKPARDRHNTSASDYWDRRFGSSHPGGCQFVFADGSMRLVSYRIELKTFQQLCHRSDGQAVRSDDY